MSFTRIQARERVNAVEGGGDQIHVVTKNGFHKKNKRICPNVYTDTECNNSKEPPSNARRCSLACRD